MINKRIKCLFWSCLVVLSCVLISPHNILAEDYPSSEAFWKKYTLTESFELGLEFSYLLPSSNHANNMGNIYVTLTHSSSSYSSYKFKTGILNGEFMLYGQNLGRINFVPLLTTYISTLPILELENPQPYYGIGLGWYFFESFNSAQKQYRTYEAENTYGYHWLVGAKYLTSSGYLMRGEIELEIIKPFRFYNDARGLFRTRNVRRIDFTNLGFTLNTALCF
ncbi:MAG: hypothetical protein QME51_01375 [Planctomycetota bacterium]|nr:hypothetical protein [Planctomycetota bacterium]MDI6787006.1 hypothetical protein [Planctomycetota bacterium]